MRGPGNPEKNSADLADGVAAAPILVEALPERLDAIEHLATGLDELVLLEVHREVLLLELRPGMRGVLVLHPVVPGEERDRHLRFLPFLEDLEALDQLLPEARGRPVLDRETGAQTDVR